MSSVRCLAVVAVFSLVGCAESQPIEADPFTGAPLDASERMPVAAPEATRGAVRDLAVSISGPAGTGLGDTETVDVTVENEGTRTARDVVLTIDLPTSGSLASISSACVVTGATAECDMGRLRAGNTDSVSIEWTAPNAIATLDFDVESSMRHTDSDPSDDSASHSIAVIASATLPISGGESFNLVGCMDAVPVTWADCASSSYLYYEQLTLNADGSVTANTTADGSWSQANTYSLELEFEDPNTQTVLSEFDALAVDSDCFEGTVYYPAYGYYGAYKMCMSSWPTP